VNGKHIEGLLALYKHVKARSTKSKREVRRALDNGETYYNQATGKSYNLSRTPPAKKAPRKSPQVVNSKNATLLARCITHRLGTYA